MENIDDNAVGINSTDPGRALNYSSVLPRSLTWIANNELHPNPEDCGGVDYAAIYKYLACLCQGKAPPDLNPPTASKVMSLLPMVAGVVKKDLKKEKAWLENYRRFTAPGATRGIRALMRRRNQSRISRASAEFLDSIHWGLMPRSAWTKSLLCQTKSEKDFSLELLTVTD